MNDDLVFADDEETLDGNGEALRWPLLIVDDEEEVHAVTKLALSGFEFAGRGLEFVSAHSAAEAREVLRERRDIAVILLDVVMETDHAGLEVADFVRNVIENRFARIVLRTGQPGQAPEREVIRRYDINDYKEKTELTAKKLFTVVYTALRSYRDLLALEANRRGLLQVVQASANLFRTESVEQFVQGVLEQVAALIYESADMLYVSSSIATVREGTHERIVAATGRFTDMVGQNPREALAHFDYHNLTLALRKQRNIVTPDHFSGYFESTGGGQHLLYVSGPATMSRPDQELIDMFLRSVALAYEAMLNRIKTEKGIDTDAGASSAQD
ncbi:MAG: DUF3369 domain-containing protein [Abyssibacter sp.]|uniref:DUF3369 domain-containing protein n=1 Tax=Abyssibacter sp. TaxID=2320200 RepID=UPI002EC2D038|nr:DUF3369 domain-containing protein [Pseudomonadota bacterium]